MAASFRSGWSRNDTVALAGGLSAATILTAIAIHIDLASGTPTADWVPFLVAASMMLIAEFGRRLALALDPSDSVNLRPVFVYAMILLGAHSVAIAIAIAAFLAGELAAAISPRRAAPPPLFDLVRTMATVTAGGLVVAAMGMRAPVTESDHGAVWTTAAILLAGLAILVLDSIITEMSTAVYRRTSFEFRLWRGIGARSIAIGSLLSLAPLWVIALDADLTMLPMLVITTILVLVSTRRSLAHNHEALNDALTGLANRRSFDTQLDDACARLGRSREVAVLVMDLDGFKQINDQLGHDVGDEVLIAFAGKLAASLPSGAVGARLGGDEFGVVLSGSTKRDRVADTIDEIRDALDEPLAVAGFPISAGVSIGVATAPRDGTDGPTLLHAADIAMYRAKRLRTKVEAYDGDHGATQTGRLGLLADLGTAIDDHQLRLDYQPQVSMADNRIIVVEALVRWEHPQYGTIAPDDFIGLAEQTDLIGPITHSVIRMAAGGLAEIGAHDVRLAVNVSVRNLEDPEFANETLATLALVHFPPERLELEITEQALLTKPEQTRETIAALRSAGVRITLDGFGTGYAPYRTLQTLQADRIKIDRDFVLRLVHDPEDQAVVRSVVLLGHELGLEVAAEGIESMDTWDTLARFGCDAAQGYGIAMPMALPVLWTWMVQWNELNHAEAERVR